MLSRMQKGSAKKIKSALKPNFGRLASFFTAISIIIFALVGALFFLCEKTKNYQQDCDGLQLQSKCVELEIVSSSEAQARGLSGRSNLPEHRAMLFEFNEPATRCIWMKDMLFDIDIVWLDERKQITKIESNVSPKTYPDSFCQENAKFVLEFSAGFVTNNGLKLGSELKF